MLAIFSLLFLISEPQILQAGDAAKDELKKLQGTWKVELQEENGKKVSEAKIKGRTISFGSNLLLVRQNAAMEQLSKTKLDPVKKSINVSVQKGKNEGDVFLGIYELDGDTFKICLSTDGDTRPTEIKGGAGRLLMVCSRTPAKTDEGDLSGKYKSESVDLSGKRIHYDATIERIGDSYMVLYTVQDKLIYVGTGVRRGNIFALAWTSQGRPGISMFQIEKGNRMVGEFTEVAGPGFFGTEMMTPVTKE